MALGDNVRDLARNDTLGDLDPEALRLIAFSAETRILRAGDILFRRGDPSDGGYLVVSGALSLEADGVATIVRPPTLVGDAALLAATQRPATATAQEPSSVLKIPRDLFHRVLGEYPESAARLRRRWAERLHVLGSDLDGARTRAFES